MHAELKLSPSCCRNEMYLFITFIQLHLLGSFQQICSDIQPTKYIKKCNWISWRNSPQSRVLIENLPCCAQAFSSCREWGCSSLQYTGFSLSWLLLQSMAARCAGFSNCGTWHQQLWHVGLVAPQHVGIFPDRALNTCPLHL